MTPRASERLTAGMVARLLERPLCGPDLELQRPVPLSRLHEGALVFARTLTEEVVQTLNDVGLVCALVPHGGNHVLSCTFIQVDNPRLAFATVVREYFERPRPSGVSPSALIGRNVRLGADVYVGHYAVIDGDVEIGDRASIAHHVSIDAKVTIGARCSIGANTVIGGAGYGFERDADGLPVRIPHLGGVTIGDDVEIGALCVVARGTLDDTVVEDGVKIDDHVFIAHNARIRRKAMIIAGAEISGSVDVGEEAWIAPQACIRNKLRIGAGATVGLGAVVVKDVPAETVVAGNPARPMTPRVVSPAERR